MTAFLKIDHCRRCSQDLPWEWMPPVTVGGRTLAGTGVWRSTLAGGLCGTCVMAVDAETRARSLQAARWADVVRLLGPKPAREFTFERFHIVLGNRLAFETAKGLDVRNENLYLWGAGSVGKTHLAFAIAGRAREAERSVVITTLGRFVRRVRMKPPDEEQHAIDALIQADVLVFDGLGAGTDTPFARQILLEVLDNRDHDDRGGLVVTSRWSPRVLGQRTLDPAITSRLEAMCRVVEIKDVDHRLSTRGSPK